MKTGLSILIAVSLMIVSSCSSTKLSPVNILPGKWEGVSKKGKIVVLEFKTNHEVVLIHGQLKLKSTKGKRKVMYELDQSVSPNRIKLIIHQYNSLSTKPKTLGMIYKVLAPDTILIAIGNIAEEYPKSFEKVSPKDKTILVKQVGTQ